MSTKVGMERGKTKFREGVVTSNKMDKTVIVAVVGKKRHPIYGKFVSFTRKFVAHDEQNKCAIGDSVKIAETRPLSKTKCWRVVEVLKAANPDDLGVVV